MKQIQSFTTWPSLDKQAKTPASLLPRLPVTCRVVKPPPGTREADWKALKICHPQSRYTCTQGGGGGGMPEL
jgi:hypothetical protein